jgi:hypothetical protein
LCGKLGEHLRSKKRVADHGEVFTAKREVNAMLDLIKQETERIESRFLEPACGTGNFLVEILRRKLTIVEKRYMENQFDFEKYTVIAVSSLYGIDILEDNLIECRTRLFDVFNAQYTKLYKTKCRDKCRDTIKFLLSKNILHGDALTLYTVNDKTKPIVFSEWSAVNDSMIKRRDFIMDNLVNTHLPEYQKHEIALFSDENDPAFLPTPIREFPVTHYLKLADNG